MRSSLVRMRSSLARMRPSLVRMRSSLVRMRFSLERMRSSLVVRASDCQCSSSNSPGFDPSIRRHSGIRGAADEAVLNIMWRTKIKVKENKRKLRSQSNKKISIILLTCSCSSAPGWEWPFPCHAPQNNRRGHGDTPANIFLHMKIFIYLLATRKYCIVDQDSLNPDPGFWVIRIRDPHPEHEFLNF